MLSPVLTLKAYAKINLGLSVLGRRADGFHEVDTLLVRLALHDTLTLEPASEGVRLVVVGPDLGISPEQNLAFRAAALYLAEIGEGRGVAIKLTKRIPAAAGLGGGSSDAGAVLRGLAQLYPAEVDLLGLASRLGSDVPFFAADMPAARASGRGEILAPVDIPEFPLVLVNPGIAVSAKDAYANLQGLTPPLKLETLLRRLERGEDPGYFNSLEAGVMGLEPRVGEVLEALRAAALAGVQMSGSGSTCFGLAQSQREAQLVAATLTEAYPEWWVHATHTL